MLKNTLSLLWIIWMLLNASAFSQVTSEKRTEVKTTGPGSTRNPVIANPENNPVKLNWRGVIREKISDEIIVQYLSFDGAGIHTENNFLPEYYFTKKLNEEPESSEVIITHEKFEELSPAEISALRDAQISMIRSQITIKSTVGFHRKVPQLYVSFIPIRKNESTGKFEKLISFRLSIQVSGTKKKLPPGRTYASSSVLSTGNWYKISVTKDGIYKISYSFFKNIGIDPEAINPQNIRIYGNGGGTLPVSNSQFRQDDLLENSIYVSGENDGKFDMEDYILFYGQGPHRWILNGNTFKHQLNSYTDTNYYFITADLGTGKRVASKPILTEYTTTISSFNDYDFYEKELINPNRSGREWLGETFSIVTDYDFVFSFPDLSAEAPVTLRAVVAGRTTSGQNIFTIKANGQNVGDVSIGSVSGLYTDIYAKSAEKQASFSSANSTLNINISMSKGNPGAQGWLDFIEVNARRKLNFSNGQVLFRDINSLGTGNVKFQLSSAYANILIWDITAAPEVKNQPGNLSGNVFEFIASADSLKEYIAFDKTAALITPVFKEKIPVQNLHASPNSDMVIVTHPLFKKESEDLAEFHRSEDNLSVVVATTDEIFNEFSSGKQDVTAIKDFLKMMYDRAGTDSASLPKYLLLFGDGSYDFKDRISGNTNFVPSYQSSESLSPTASYVSDDYFGLLDDTEGESTGDYIDLGIGRLLAKNSEEALNAVNKIKHYYSPETMRPWRNYLTFVADDEGEDGTIHMNQANQVAGIVESNYQKFNIDKIFMDAYRQEVNSGGQRYPDVNNAINRRIEMGTLMMTWIGHGGELGWAHERILEIPQINKWNNMDNLALVITATCEFTRFDDPQRTSAGEFVFLNPSGGGIGLFSTTRLVYSSSNFELMQAFNNVAFEGINNIMPRLGDISRIAKINGPKGINTRSFMLVGDPALRLAYPRYNVITTLIPDTIKALGRVTIKGFVADDDSIKIPDFNGIIYPLVFDKPMNINTLNNDNIYVENDSGVAVPLIFKFKSQKNILFKGKASVKNGEFEYSFVVPKDIAYNFGNGKISYYSQNGETDASGYYTSFIIGGSDSAAVADNAGPQIQLFLNDEKFVFGGMTDENPKLFAKLFDENGINTVGNGIGHDIVAILDENTSNSIVLNDYYEADINSYQKGSIRFPLKDLQEGPHTLRLKAFDVYNNSGEANTEFIVAKSAELALEHVLNYPNPFTTSTAFYFEHNQPGQNLDISIQIFTVSGKLVKSIDSYVYADSFRAGPVYWNGLDDFGDKIGRGVYVYKLKVTAPTGQVVNKFEKLVVLN